MIFGDPTTSMATSIIAHQGERAHTSAPLDTLCSDWCSTENGREKSQRIRHNDVRSEKM